MAYAVIGMGTRISSVDGIRNFLGWVLVLLLLVPWLVIQLAAGLTRLIVRRRGGLD